MPRRWKSSRPQDDLHPQTPEHAQFAFDTALDILSFAPRSTRVAIVLGTGEMGGDFFGTASQFQVVGAAVAVTDRLLALPNRADPSIRMTQLTRDRIETSKELRAEGASSGRGSKP